MGFVAVRSTNLDEQGANGQPGFAFEDLPETLGDKIFESLPYLLLMEVGNLDYG